MVDEKSRMPEGWTTDLFFEKTKARRVDKLLWVKSWTCGNKAELSYLISKSLSWDDRFAKNPYTACGERTYNGTFAELVGLLYFKKREAHVVVKKSHLYIVNGPDGNNSLKNFGAEPDFVVNGKQVEVKWKENFNFDQDLSKVITKALKKEPKTEELLILSRRWQGATMRWSLFYVTREGELLDSVNATGLAAEVKDLLCGGCTWSDFGVETM